MAASDARQARKGNPAPDPYAGFRANLSAHAPAMSAALVELEGSAR